MKILPYHKSHEEMIDAIQDLKEELIKMDDGKDDPLLSLIWVKLNKCLYRRII